MFNRRLMLLPAMAVAALGPAVAAPSLSSLLPAALDLFGAPLPSHAPKPSRGKKHRYPKKRNMLHVSKRVRRRHRRS